MMTASLRPWHRLGFRIVGLFVLVLLAIAVTFFQIYRHQREDLEETLKIRLLNIARLGALGVDAGLHAEVAASRSRESEAYRRLAKAVAAVREEVLLTTPVYTLTDYDAARRQARVVAAATSDDETFVRPGQTLPLVAEQVRVLTRTFEDALAWGTGIYRRDNDYWMSAFAPVVDASGKTVAVLAVDYPVEVYIRRLNELLIQLAQACLVALVALALAVWVSRRVTRPIGALTRGVARVAGGDLTVRLPVPSADEVGRLTGAFNEMVEEPRQRDFIRNTFGRYVSPEVAKAILESPEGLRLGGEKRQITVLMSDLRGYTRFAEKGDPAWVMEVLNDYLGRMTDIIIAHGGTINEFMGDGIFAVYGAPVAHPDHPERAAASALAMQCAMEEINTANTAQGRPRFEMGIGIHTGEAVVGDIGSEQRTKYAVVGAAVNLASRVESCTVGGQILLSPSTYERIRSLVEVSPPVPVEVKGIQDPLLLYELRSIGGSFAQSLPESVGADVQVDVTLPASFWVIEGKVVQKEILAGVVHRLGSREIGVALDRPLSPLTNVKLRLRYPGLGHDSGDLYGKCLGQVPGDHRLSRIRLTSVDTLDQKILEGLLGWGDGTSNPETGSACPEGGRS